VHRRRVRSGRRVSVQRPGRSVRVQARHPARGVREAVAGLARPADQARMPAAQSAGRDAVRAASGVAEARADPAAHRVRGGSRATLVVVRRGAATPVRRADLPL